MVLPDFMEEVYDLISHVTELADDYILRGNQSREVLPDDNDFCVYTPLRQKRIGTNISELQAEGVRDNQNAPNVDSELVQIDVQIDFYGDDAYATACGFETFCGSFQCNDWLTKQNKSIRVLYASDPTDLTYVDETEQYVQRWMLTMSICITSEYSVKIPWFEDVIIQGTKVDPSTGHLTPASKAGIVDVDVFFKP